MNEFKKFITDNGGNLDRVMIGIWKILSYLAVAGDEADKLIPGVTYKVLIAQDDGKTQLGKEVKKGDVYFFPETK